MSMLSEYTKKEALLRQLQEELQALESNQEMKKELEFKSKLEQLMEKHGKTSDDVIDILDPNGEMTGRQQQEEPKTQGQRAKRKLKKYTNPHTGEVVETRGGNQKTLKMWKDQHGSETVESWLETDQQQTVSADPEDKPVPSSKKKKQTA